MPQAEQTPQLLRVFEAAQVTWQTDTGALLGMLGGSGSALLDSDKK